MAAYVVLVQQVHDDPGYRPVKEIRFSITSRGQAVVAPEWSPAGSAAR